jgi:hypothetical protein
MKPRGNLGGLLPRALQGRGMIEQFTNLDERSFLHKSFWRELREDRAQT